MVGLLSVQLQNVVFHSRAHLVCVCGLKWLRSTFSVTSKLTERLQDVSRCQVLHFGKCMHASSDAVHQTRPTRLCFRHFANAERFDLVLVELSLNSLTG